MLDIHHEGPSLVVALRGSLDEPADGILAVVASNRGSSDVVIDLTHANSIRDGALARVAAHARRFRFRELRAHHERLLTYLAKAS